ncbi:MAG: T9SS type A sorting domain-containing protein, partial [bacterium]
LLVAQNDRPLHHIAQLANVAGPSVFHQAGQLIIYDTTRAAADGNSVFTYQYLTANHYGSATVGINDSTTTTGIQVVFYDDYHRAALPLEPGRAIKFTTNAPAAGVGESPTRREARADALRVLPNPFTAGTLIRYSTGLAGRVELAVYDAAGREVERLAFEARAGDGRYYWRPQGLAPGVYFLKLRTPDREFGARVLLLE